MRMITVTFIIIFVINTFYCNRQIKKQLRFWVRSVYNKFALKHSKCHSPTTKNVKIFHSCYSDLDLDNHGSQLCAMKLFVL